MIEIIFGAFEILAFDDWFLAPKTALGHKIGPT